MLTASAFFLRLARRIPPAISTADVVRCAAFVHWTNGHFSPRRANLKEADANRIGFFFCAFRDESHWPSAQLMSFDVLRLFTDWFFAHMHQLGKSLNSVSGKLLQISIVLLVVNYFSELVSVLDGNFFMALF